MSKLRQNWAIISNATVVLENKQKLEIPYNGSVCSKPWTKAQIHHPITPHGVLIPTSVQNTTMLNFLLI